MKSFQGCLLAMAMVAGLCFGVQPAFACSCAPGSIERLLQSPVTIFTGTAVSTAPGSKGTAVRTRFTVETVWKGEAADSFTVEAETQSAACGVVFDIGKSYTVAVREVVETGAYSTNLCTMLSFMDPATHDATQAALRAYKEAGAEPQSFAGQEQSGFDLSNRDLALASFAGATLGNGTLAWSRLTGASFAGVRLDSVDLSGADLRGALFAGAQLTAVDLSGAHISGADFSGATLAKASLRDVDFADADLSGASLRDADLAGADLGAASLAGADLSGARYDSRTVWPDGFDPVGAGAVASE